MKRIAIVFSILIAGALVATSAPLTSERATPMRDGAMLMIPQGSNIIYAGAIVAIDATGRAVPGSATVGLIGIGRAEVTSDNRSPYDANKMVLVRRGVYQWYAATNTISAADVGKPAYIIDDQTVGRASESTNAPLGRIFWVDMDGVWVDTTDR